MSSADVLKFLGPLIGSAVGVAIAIAVVRRRRRESADWQPAPWIRRVFFGLVGTFMLVAGVAGIAADKSTSWVPALVAGLISIALLWSVEVATKKQRPMEPSVDDHPTGPAGSDEGPRAVK